jgi:hypothetical protein
MRSTATVVRSNSRLLVGLMLLAATLFALPPAAEAGHRAYCARPYYGYGGWGYGNWGWGGYWGPWGGWGGYTVVYPMAGRDHGALDLDVTPERAQVYVNGQLAGEADDFDGFPDFLWLENGTYDIAIYHPGFQTIARQITIYGGQVIDVGDRMTPGQETLPEDLVSKSTVNRDERIRRDRETEEEVEAGEREWRRQQAEESDELDARGEPGRAIVHVTPGDASIYLDGRFLGTGHELSRLRSGLIVDPGEHRLEAVRPGHESMNRSFEVDPGEEIELVLELAPED